MALNATVSTCSRSALVVLTPEKIIDTKTILATIAQGFTMNHWQTHLAAKRRFRARKDILGLLQNSQRRKSKAKKTKPITRNKFGLFAKTISFEVSLIDPNAADKSPSTRKTDDGHKKDVISNKRLKKQSKAKKCSLAKNRRQNDNIFTEQQAAEKSDEIPISVASSICFSDGVVDRQEPANFQSFIDWDSGQKENHNEPFQSDQLTQKRRTQEKTRDDTLDSFQAPVESRHKRMPFDLLPVQDERTRSAGFSQFQNLVEAKNCPSFDDVFELSGGLTECSSKDSAHKKSQSNKSNESSWSLGSRYFSSSSSLSGDGSTTFQSKDVSNDLPTPKNGNQNKCSEISSLSFLTVLPDDQIQQRLANTQNNNFDCSQSASSDGLESFNSRVGLKSVLENEDTVDGVDATSKEQQKIQRFLKMVIEQKRLGARRAHERLFDASYSQTNLLNVT